MARIYRVRSALTGFAGGPGVMTTYCLDPAGYCGALLTFWNLIKNNLPMTVTVAIETTGDQIEATDGQLVGSWNIGANFGIPQTGETDGPYAAPVGAMIVWNTETIVDGHHLRGRSFIVPLLGAAYDTDGSLVAAALLDLRAQADALVAATANNAVVWHRPRKASVAHPVARAGSYAFVSSATVPDRVAVLSSRRA